ncbi:Aste57867_1172 [Aphanomyces stellatus]|uniref:Aste57867_1172 protein n=1 Tax=Aphanomyces stellatus TaxID=120398 RepID=A0A485K4Z5_9STRA|nr:hypothetical protein As57867_001171 [Aphanomyces stellatus]VFT78392.1 Aste57867_1172 [Aphanomyces stellatus]
MTSERTPLFNVAEAQDNSRSKKAMLLAVGTLGALATIGLVHHHAVAAPVTVSGLTVSMDADPTEAPTPISSSTPGTCKRTSDCTKYGADYSCVAVESAIPGLTLLSQCVRGAVCTGNVNGACPSFSSWAPRYRQVQPVCAFAEAKNCNNAVAADGTSSNDTNSNKTVSCFAATFTNAKGDEKEVNGLYKCVDTKVYAANKMGYLDLTPTQLQACVGNTTTDANGVTRTAPLCNGHGTCAPTKQFGSIYGCSCNAGYSSADNCNTIVGNVCDNFGQCGVMGSCSPTNGTCVCKVGAKGDQCAKCDVTAPQSNVCSGRGSCGVDATCQCPQGYEGLHCETASKSSSNSSSTSTPTTITSAASGVALSSLAALAVMAVSFMF